MGGDVLVETWLGLKPLPSLVETTWLLSFLLRLLGVLLVLLLESPLFSLVFDDIWVTVR